MNLKHLPLYCIILISALILFSCSKEIDENIELYSAEKVQNLKAQSGKNKIILSWINPPNIDYVTVTYYIDGTEKEVKVESKDLPSHNLEVVVNDQQVYKFTLIAYNSAGERSEEQTVKGKALSENNDSDENPYNIILETVKMYSSPDGVKITWENEKEFEAKILVTFINDLGKEVVVEYDAASMIKESTINDLKIGNEVKFSVEVKNDNKSSTFTRTFNATPKNNIVKLDKSKWTITGSSEETLSEDGALINLIDGSPKTYWKSQIKPTAASYPHYVIIDMKEVVNVTAISLERKWGDSENSSWDNRVSVSMDGVNWETEYDYDNKQTDPLLKIEFNRTKDGEQFYPLPSPAKGRYVKATFKRSSKTFALFGEMSIYGYY